MKWRQLIRNSCQHIGFYLLVGLGLQIVVGGLMVALIGGIFRLLLGVVGIQALDLSTIGQVLKNPLSYLIFLVIFLVVALAIYIEFSVLSFITYYHQTGQYIALKDIIKRSLLGFRRLLSPQIGWLLAYFVLMIPLGNLGLGSIISDQLHIPNFITGELLKNKWTTGVYIGGTVLIFYVNIRMILVLPLLMLSELKVVEAIKQSFRLTKRRWLKLLGQLIVGTILVSVVLAIAGGLTLGFVVLVDHYFTDLTWLIAGIGLTIFEGLFLFGLAIGKMVVVHLLVYFLRKYEPSIGQGVIVQVSPKIRVKRKRKFVKVAYGLFFVVLIAINGLILMSYRYRPTTKVIAHRGYTFQAVENSLEALIACADMDVDYVEMDVIQTKDGHFVVIHDYNLKRLAGIDQRVDAMTLAEIKEVSIQQKGMISRIPTLEEYIEKALEMGLKLNIEMKLHGHETTDYLEEFVACLKKYDVDQKFIVQSLDLDFVESLNTLYPSMTVGHIVPFQVGGLNRRNIDFIVVEEFSYSDKLLSDANNRRLPVYVWTVNESNKIRQYLMLGADGIISDELKEVKQIRQDLEQNNRLSDRLFQFIEAFF